MTEFVECKYGYKALDKCPWTARIIPVDNGYVCFDSYEEYLKYKRKNGTD